MKIILLDMDGTITEPGQNIDNEMLEILISLLRKYKIGIISGASFSKINKQVLRFLESNKNVYLSNLYILPNQGGELYIYNNFKWIKKYEYFSISLKEFEYIKNVINNLNLGYKIYGNKFEYKGSQISYFVTGDKTPYKIAKEFDLSGEERLSIIKQLEEKLPSYIFGIGGFISIDITKKGLDKSFGVQKILYFLKIIQKEALYIGDSFFKGGNDYPVCKLGINILKVKNLKETRKNLTKYSLVL